MAISSKCQSHVQCRRATFSLGNFYFFSQNHPPFPHTEILPFCSSNPHVARLQPPSLFGVHYFFKSLTGESGRRGLWKGGGCCCWRSRQHFGNCFSVLNGYCSEVTDVRNYTAHTHQHFIVSKRGEHFTPGFSINVSRVSELCIYSPEKRQAVKINIQKLFRSTHLICFVCKGTLAECMYINTKNDGNNHNKRDLCILTMAHDLNNGLGSIANESFCAGINWVRSEI
jgi:hypothetical protein